MWIVTGWEDTEHRLYHNFENAKADYDSMKKFPDMRVDEDYEEGEVGTENYFATMTAYCEETDWNYTASIEWHEIED